MKREYRNGIVDVLLICAVFSIFLPIFAGAQSLTGLSSSITLSVSPNYPAPGSMVKISVSDTFQNLEVADITWYQDGKVILKGVGETSVEVKAGAYGSRSTVEAEVVDLEGNSSSASTIISPAQVDILLDANTYTHPFYRGRSLATGGGTIRLQALANFIQGSTAVADNAITYTWRRNDQVIGSVSGRGKSAITIPAPQLFSSDTITVEAASVDGRFSGSASISIPSADPVLALYLNHPLYGIMYHDRISPTSNVAESIASFTAVPYFADINSTYDPIIRFAWRVNGKPIAASSTRQDTLTVRAEGQNANAKIELDVSSRLNVFMSGSNAWNMTFASSKASTGGVGSEDDIFHSGE